MSARRLMPKESWLSDRQAKGHKGLSNHVLQQVADGEGTYVRANATEKAVSTTLLKRLRQARNEKTEGYVIRVAPNSGKIYLFNWK